MAKDISQKYTIAADGAIDSLKRISDSLDKHNEAIKRGEKNQQAYNTQAKTTSDTFKTINTRLTSLAGGFDKATERLKNLREQFRLGTTNAEKLSTALGNMTIKGREARTMLDSLATEARDAATSISQMQSALVAHSANVRKDTQHLQYNTVALKEFGTEVRKLVKDMGLKNRTIDQQVAAQQRDTQAAADLTAGYRVLSSIIISLFIHRAITEMIAGMRAATNEAQELQLRLGEMATVSLEMTDSGLKAAKSTGDWTNELSILQRTYGLGILDQAAATYEALSAQVVTASNSSAFLAQESKLAITAVSTLAEATKITSDIINAYGLTADDAARINATLFAGVDIGSFRLNELGNSFARANVIANQINISFEEVTGALALLTRKGLDAESSSTLLLNVFNGLVKPTKELNAFFAELGLSNAEVALKTLGFVGVMQKLAEAVDNGNGKVTQMAEYFDDIRGLVGASGLSGAFARLGQDIAYVSNATDRANQAFKEQMDNLGVRGKIELEKFKQYFLLQFGLPIQQTLVEIAESFGGADKAMSRFAAILFNVTILGGTFWASQKLLIPLMQGLGVSFVTAAGGATAYAGALTSVAVAQGVVSLGVSVLVTGLTYLYFAEARAAQAAKMLALEMGANVFKQNQEELEKYTLALEQHFKVITDQSPVSRYFRKFQEIRVINQQMLANFEETYDAIFKAMKEGLDGFEDQIGDKIKALEKEIDKLQKGIENGLNRIQKLKLKSGDQAFEEQLVGKTDIEAAQILIQQRDQLFALANQALAQNNETLAQEFFDRVDRLHQQAIDRIVAAKKEAEKIINDGNIAVNNQGGFNIRNNGVSVQQNTRNRGQGVKTTINIPLQHQQDAQRAALLADQLKNLEAERLQIVQARIKAENDAVARQEQQLKLKEAEKQKLEQNLKAFLGYVKEIDRFENRKGNPDELRKALGLAQQAGVAAGLDPKEIFNTLRQGFVLEDKLRREAVVQASEEKLQALQKQLEVQGQLEKKAIEDQKKAAIDAQKAIGDVIQKNVEQSILLQQQIQQIGPGGANVVFGNEEQAKEALRVDALRQKLLDDIAKLKDLSINLQTSKATGDKGQIAKDLLLIEKLQENILKNFEQFQKSDIVTGLANKKVPRDKNGNILGAAAPGEVPKTLKEQFEALKKLTDEAERAQAVAAQTAINEKNVLEAQKQLTLQLRQVAKAHEKILIASGASGNKAVEAYQQANAIFDQTIIKLREINALLNAQVGGAGPGFAHGGPVLRANGGGGHGTDRIHAMLSRGEFVLDRLATRQYAPILPALNRQPPTLRSNGGSVINFGDTHIHTAAGTTEQQAAQIGRHLQRRVRRGLYKGN